MRDALGLNAIVQVPPLLEGPPKWAFTDTGNRLGLLTDELWTKLLGDPADVGEGPWQQLVESLPSPEVLDWAKETTVRQTRTYVHEHFGQEVGFSPEQAAGGDAVDKARSAGLRQVIPLPVAGPFHQWVATSGTLLVAEDLRNTVSAYRSLLLALDAGD